jgi:hypothetical protein
MTCYGQYSTSSVASGRSVREQAAVMAVAVAAGDVHHADERNANLPTVVVA